MPASSNDANQEGLENNERTLFDQECFVVRRPNIWIPRDYLGFSKLEIKRLQQRDSSLKFRDSGATIDAKGEIIIEDKI